MSDFREQNLGIESIPDLTKNSLKRFSPTTLGVVDSIIQESSYLNEKPIIDRYIYLLYSDCLNAVKVGVGRSRRINEIITSKHKEATSSNFIESSWQILRIAVFLPQSQNGYFDEKRIISNWSRQLLYAEEKILAYWHSELKLTPFLTTQQMGVTYDLKRKIHGESETVKMEFVCEITTWRLLSNLAGFTEISLGADNDFPKEGRELRCHLQDHDHEKYITDGSGIYDEWTYAPTEESFQEDEINSATASELLKTKKLHKKARPHRASTSDNPSEYECLESGCKRQSASRDIRTYCRYHHIRNRKRKEKRKV